MSKQKVDIFSDPKAQEALSSGLTSSMLALAAMSAAKLLMGRGALASAEGCSMNVQDVFDRRRKELKKEVDVNRDIRLKELNLLERRLRRSGMLEEKVREPAKKMGKR